MWTQEDNWYKPAPGEPYFPRFAFPTKLKDIDPLWASCGADEWFTAFDPPRTLVPVSALGPETTMTSQSTAPAPHSAVSHLAADATPAPVSTPELAHPRQTAMPQPVDPGTLHGHSSLRKPIPTQGGSPEHGSSNFEETAAVPNIAHSEIGPGDAVHDGGTFEVQAPTTMGQPKIPIQSFNNPFGLSPSNTASVDPSSRPSIVTPIGGNAATLRSHIIDIGSKTVARDDPSITISGTVISLDSTALVFAPTPLPLPSSQQVVPDIAGTQATLFSNAVAIAGTTLHPDDPPFTLSDMVMSISSFSW